MTELVRTYKLTDSGAWGWVTEEAEGGGGGSLPSWWTVDNTPGAESVDFGGQVVVSAGGVYGNSGAGFEVRTTDPAAQPFLIVLPDDFANGAYTAFRILRPGQDPSIFNEDLATIEMDGLYLRAGPGEGANKPVVNLLGDAGSPGVTQLANGKLRGAGAEIIAWNTGGGRGLGFFGATPVDQPTGVAATGPGVHAALVSLGLIAA